MLTPRENYFNYVTGKDYEWIPSSYDQIPFTPEIIPDSVARGEVMQQNRYDRSKFGGPDWFGVNWIFDPKAAGMGGSMEEKPLFEDACEWRDYVKFPDLSKLDWKKSAEENKEYLNTDKIICTTIHTGLFERLISFIGFENALIALVDEDCQDDVKELFDKLADFYIELTSYLKKYYNTEMIYFHDDWGSQHAPLMSLETHQEMIVPYLKKIATACLEMGVMVEMHSCGKIEKLIPNLIGTNIVTWRGQNINDKKMLVDNYGDKFIFKVMVTENFSDDCETSLKKAADLYELYKGQKIMMDYPRWLSPDDSAKLAAFARTHRIEN